MKSVWSCKISFATRFRKTEIMERLSLYYYRFSCTDRVKRAHEQESGFLFQCIVQMLMCDKGVKWMEHLKLIHTFCLIPSPVNLNCGWAEILVSEWSLLVKACLPSSQLISPSSILMSFSHLIFDLIVPRGGGGVVTLAKKKKARGRIFLGHSARTSAIQMLFTFTRLVSSSSAHVYNSRRLITTIIYGNVFDACISYNDIRTAIVSPAV
jgi:hypothetical protein